MLPSFVIIGAMKGGTSSLYRYLGSHPDVVPSSTKETDFFMTIDNFKKGLGWYESLFKGKGECAFEASPNYTKRHIHPDIPPRMRSVLPGAKLIYTLRDPVDRVLSHYIHNYSRGREPLSLSEAISDPNSNYVQSSRYYYQIQPFLEHYSEDQLLIADSDELRNDTANTMDSIYTFLGLSLDYDKSILETRFHESSVKKQLSPLEQSLLNKTSNPVLRVAIYWLLKPFRKSFEKPTLTEEDRNRLAEIFAPDVEQMRRFSGLKFSSWSL